MLAAFTMTEIRLISHSPLGMTVRPRLLILYKMLSAALMRDSLSAPSLGYTAMPMLAVITGPSRSSASRCEIRPRLDDSDLSYKGQF